MVTNEDLTDPHLDHQLCKGQRFRKLWSSQTPNCLHRLPGQPTSYANDIIFRIIMGYLEPSQISHVAYIGLLIRQASNTNDILLREIMGYPGPSQPPHKLLTLTPW